MKILWLAVWATLGVCVVSSSPTLRSFEEWRIHNLRQSGQDIDNTPTSTKEPQKSPNDAGSDMDPFAGEIDFLFAPPDDSGGKTYKDRFNYASFDCGATVVKSNKDVKGARSILVENKDSYLLNKCSASNKHVIIELCQDILVEQVEVGNYEFFSSMFKDIRISVADRYPVTTGEWRVLGTFQAANIRDLQTFNITVPQIWARYVKLEFLTHWGHEYYCPISVVRVHGTTMMEEWKRSGSEEITPVEPAKAAVEERPSPSPTTVEGTISASLNHTVIEKGECVPEIVLDKVKLGLNEYCYLDEFYQQLGSAANRTINPINGTQSTPSTQESIYKTIMKRLSLLESNATLSLQYVEEQSKVLRDLLYRIEKKQNTKIDDFLFHFNATVIQQLLVFSQQKEQKLNRALMELDFQKSLADKNMEAISQRFALLADDLVFQKRMSMFQGVILLVVLIFVAATRAPGHEFSRRLRPIFHTDSEGDADFSSLRNHLRKSFQHNIESRNDNDGFWSFSPRTNSFEGPHSVEYMSPDEDE